MAKKKKSKLEKNPANELFHALSLRVHGQDRKLTSKVQSAFGADDMKGLVDRPVDPPLLSAMGSGEMEMLAAYHLKGESARGYRWEQWRDFKHCCLPGCGGIPRQIMAAC